MAIPPPNLSRLRTYVLFEDSGYSLNLNFDIASLPSENGFYVTGQKIFKIGNGLSNTSTRTRGLVFRRV